MKKTANPLFSYYEAQMTGTAGIVRATLDGLQRVQEIALRAMRDSAGGQLGMARSMAGARDPAEAARAQMQGAQPAAEQATRYQQELLQAITEVNTDVLRASYAMMERLSSAVNESAAAMGVQLPAGMAGGSAGMQNPLAMYEAGMKQWQQAVDSMSRQMGTAMEADDVDEDDDDEVEGATTASRARPKVSRKSKGGRR